MAPKWRTRGNGRVAYWVAAPGLVKLGFRPKTVRLWAGLEPSAADLQAIRAHSDRLDDDARSWRQRCAAAASPATPPRQRTGLVYFARIGTHVKIGFTTDIETRMADLRTGTPTEAELIGVIDGTPEIERFIHWLFRRQHIRGEWFEEDEALSRFMADHARPVLRPPNRRKERRPNGLGNAWGTPPKVNETSTA